MKTLRNVKHVECMKVLQVLSVAGDPEQRVMITEHRGWEPIIVHSFHCGESKAASPDDAILSLLLPVTKN